MRAALVRLILCLAVVFSIPGLISPAQAGLLLQTATPVVIPTVALSLPGIDPAPPPGFDFSGYIEIPYSALLNFTAGALTIEAWVNRSESSRNETLFGNGWEDSYWLGFSSTGKLRFTPDGYAHHADSLATIPADSWTHVAIVFNSGTYSFFINGVLDSTVTQSGAALVPAPNGASLGIGFDRNDTFNPNYFSGYIDELRLWRSARTPQQIQDGMYSYVGGPATNLVAEWRLDGDANDSTGAHNGIPHGGGVIYTNYGVLPRNIRIPQVSSANALDGVCGINEYANATNVSIFASLVYLQHTANDLWVCMYDLGGSNTSANLYLDPQTTRMDPAQSEHLRLQVTSANQTNSYIGNAAGGYVISSTLDSHWDAIYQISGEFQIHSAEYRVSSTLLGGWDHPMGLAISKVRTLLNIPIASLWPAQAVSNLPSSWSEAILAGIGPTRIFRGSVNYVPKNTTLGESPVGGVKLTVVGYDPGGSEAVVGSTQSIYTGNFSITTNDSYGNHRLEIGDPPKGLVYKNASPGTGGTVIDERSIDFGNAGGGSYNSNFFRLQDAIPYLVDTQNGPIYQIVASQAVIDAGALEDFAVYKARLGFTIQIESLEEIDAQQSGANRMERIRNFEINQRLAYGERFQYVLLVGSQTTIPHIQLAFGVTGKGDNKCSNLSNPNKKVSFKYSDWFYVDLLSNFDSNGNGCYGDGIFTKLSDLAPGYIPDSGILFDNTLSLGRMPFDDPDTVRQALKNSADFERQSKPYKTRTLFGMSMVALEGYRQNGDDCDNWGERCVAVNDDRNYDMAVLPETLKLFALNALNFTVDEFYQNTSTIAGGSGFTSATEVSPAALVSALNSQLYGFLNFDGHGNGAGVYTVDWPGDLNSNGVMNLHSNASLNEVSEGDMIRTTELDSVTADNGLGGVYYIMACSTADPNTSDNFASRILSQGDGVASIASMSVVLVGSWTGPDKSSSLAQHDNYYIAQRILHFNQRLGEAVWGTFSERLMIKANGTGQIASTLMGDPSLSFLGNPSAGTRLASWSMQRREPNGQAYFTLPGPALPKQLWEYAAAAPAPSLPRPSPVVSPQGEVIVGAGNALHVLRNGSLFQSLNLDAQAFGSPAVAADGTLYAVDVNGKVYAFSLPTIPFPNSQRARRWAVPLGGAALTSPTIAPDGSILVGFDQTLSLSGVGVIRPDGNLYKNVILLGKIQQAVTASAERMVYAATEVPGIGGGVLYALDPYCLSNIDPCRDKLLVLDTGFSTAPLLAYGSLYVGLADGRFFQLDPHTLQVTNSQNTGARITAGPVTGPGGQVLIGNSSAHFYSYGQNLTPRWNRFIGDADNSVPAFSTNHLYLSNGDMLVAFSPTSGQKVWQMYFPGAGNGSAAVGYGRQVYFQTSSGRVIALGEAWVEKPTFVLANAAKLGTRPANVISWLIPGVVSHASPNWELPEGENKAPQSPAGTQLGVLLQRSFNGGDWQDLGLLPPGTTVYTDTALTAEAGYQYRLQIIDSGGENSDFAFTEAIQSLPVLPGTPSMQSVTPIASTSLRVSWNAPANSQVDHYRLERGPTSGGPFSPLSVVGGATEVFTDTLLNSGSSYFYRVTAGNQTGESAPSAALGATTWTQGLPAPTNLSALLQDGGEVILSWAGRPQGAQAVVEVLPFGTVDWLPLATLSVDNYNYFPGEAGAYDFRVKFIQGSNESPYTMTSASVVLPQNLSLYLPMLRR